MESSTENAGVKEINPVVKKAQLAPLPLPEDAEGREKEEDKNDAEESKAPIAFTYLGSSDCPVSSDLEEIEFSMSYRIPKIENLENCTQLKVCDISDINFFRDWVCVRIWLRRLRVCKIVCSLRSQNCMTIVSVTLRTYTI